jgi:hypothetical protein
VSEHWQDGKRRGGKKTNTGRSLITVHADSGKGFAPGAFLTFISKTKLVTITTK